MDKLKTSTEVTGETGVSLSGARLNTAFGVLSTSKVLTGNGTAPTETDPTAFGVAITSKLSTGEANSTESIDVSGFGEDSARTTNGEFSPNIALCNINGLTGFKSGATLTTGFGVLSTSTETTDFGIIFELIVVTAIGAESVARTRAGLLQTFVTASGAESVTSIECGGATVETLFGKVPPDTEIGAEGVGSFVEVTGFGLLSPDTEVTVAGVESTTKEDNGFGVAPTTIEVMSFGEDSGSIEVIGFGELCGVTEDTASGSNPTDTEVTPVLISATT